MYDPPRDVNTFIHRSGRTARKGAVGVVTCLMHPSELSFYNQLRYGDSHAALQAIGGRKGRSPPSKENVSSGVTGNGVVETARIRARHRQR